MPDTSSQDFLRLLEELGFKSALNQASSLKQYLPYQAGLLLAADVRCADTGKGTKGLPRSWMLRESANFSSWFPWYECYQGSEI